MPLGVQITESVVLSALHSDTQRDQRTQQIFTYCFLAMNQPHLGHHLSSVISSRSFGLSSCLLNPSHFWLEYQTFPCDPPIYISVPTQASGPASFFFSLPPLWLLLATFELSAGVLQWPHKQWDAIHIPHLPIKPEICTSSIWQCTGDNEFGSLSYEPYSLVTEHVWEHCNTLGINHCKAFLCR